MEHASSLHADRQSAASTYAGSALSNALYKSIWRVRNMGYLRRACRGRACCVMRQVRLGRKLSNRVPRPYGSRSVAPGYRTIEGYLAITTCRVSTRVLPRTVMRY